MAEDQIVAACNRFFDSRGDLGFMSLEALVEQPQVKSSITAFVSNLLVTKGNYSVSSDGSSVQLNARASLPPTKKLKESKEFSNHEKPKLSKQKTDVQRHRHQGIYIIRQRNEDFLATIPASKNTPLWAGSIHQVEEEHYQKMNPFETSLAACLLGGIDEIFLKSGAHVAFSGTHQNALNSLVHIRNIVGPLGQICAYLVPNSISEVELKLEQIRALRVTLLTEYSIPERNVDTIFIDEQFDNPVKILSTYSVCAKSGSSFLMFLNAEIIAPGESPHIVFANIVKDVRDLGWKPTEQLTLEPYYQNCAYLLGKKV